MSRKAKPWFYKQTGWWMAWLAGQKVKLAKGKKNKKEAQDRLDELRFEMVRNPSPDSSEQTVASVIETYLKFATGDLAENTLGVRKPYLQSFAEAHGFRTVRECKPLHMREWMMDHPEWESDWTKNGAIRNVQVAFNWAVANQLIPANPFKGVTHHVGQPRRDMTEEEFRAILRSTQSKGRKKLTPGARFRQILLFLWLTGARPSEAAKLRWENVDFERQLIILPEHKTSRTQRTPRPRVIPLHPIVVRLLMAIRKRNEGEYVFLTCLHTPWDKNSLGQRLKRARKRAGVSEEAKLYGVRHAFGTRAVVQNVPLKTLAELLGHTTTRMTEHYVHLAGQYAHLVAAMQIVNARRPTA